MARTPILSGALVCALGALMLAGAARAAPVLSPSSGTINALRTVFEYQANGTPVQDFWIYIGTSYRGREIVDSRSLGSIDRTYTAVDLPEGPVYVTLWYRANDVWQREEFTFDAERTEATIVTGSRSYEEADFVGRYQAEASCPAGTTAVGVLTCTGGAIKAGILDPLNTEFRGDAEGAMCIARGPFTVGGAPAQVVAVMVSIVCQ